MKKILAYFVFSVLVIQSSSAGTKQVLHLRAMVPSTLKVKVEDQEVHDSKTRIRFNTQSNQKNSNKIELSGHQQAGLRARVKALSVNARKADYEILIDHLKNDQMNYDPVFIKISAN